MAILYGTLTTGEAIPVLADESGRLMTEGRKGERGDQGPPGPQGPPGDGGDVIVPAGLVCYSISRTDFGQWLLCDGRAVDKQIYRDLLLLLDYQFGADQDGNPRIPDLRGEFVRGLDNGRNIDPDRRMGSHQGDTIGSHRHQLHNYWAQDGSGGNFAYGWYAQQCDQIGDKFTDDAGSAETRPRNIALNAFISSSVLDSQRALAYQNGTLDMVS